MFNDRIQHLHAEPEDLPPSGHVVGAPHCILVAELHSPNVAHAASALANLTPCLLHP